MQTLDKRYESISIHFAAILEVKTLLYFGSLLVVGLGRLRFSFGNTLLNVVMLGMLCTLLCVPRDCNLVNLWPRCVLCNLCPSLSLSRPSLAELPIGAPTLSLCCFHPVNIVVNCRGNVCLIKGVVGWNSTHFLICYKILSGFSVNLAFKGGSTVSRTGIAYSHSEIREGWFISFEISSLG